jgi:hypothetical protein
MTFIALLTAAVPLALLVFTLRIRPAARTSRHRI